MKELSLEMRQHADGMDNVVFDVGNVLFRFDPEHITRHLLREEHRERLHHALFVQDHEWVWGKFDEGLFSDEQVARNIAAQEGVPDLWPEILYAVFHFHEDRVPLPLAEDIPVLKAMGKKVFALTNYNENAFNLIRHKMPFFQWMDGIVVSGEEKICKPDARIYELLLSRYHLDRSRTLFIDDTLKNVEGAQRAGIRGWHYLPPDMR